jgi:hypothetical protein
MGLKKFKLNSSTVNQYVNTSVLSCEEYTRSNRRSTYINLLKDPDVLNIINNKKLDLVIKN